MYKIIKIIKNFIVSRIIFLQAAINLIYLASLLLYFFNLNIHKFILCELIIIKYFVYFFHLSIERVMSKFI